MNGSVVRVRREPNDTTAGIDDEERFSANQVQDGTLERWVNGELESTLPADVATAAAAYSLRKVKASYSGNAVRIRRSSDDIEVDVAFDSDGKVSASSAITNVAEQGGESGSTTATDLNGFLNESGVNVGMGGDFFDQNSQATINATSSNGFTATVAKTNTNAFDIRASSQSYNNVKKGTVTISYNIVQNTLSNSFKIELYKLVGSDYEIVDTVPVGTTGSRSVTVENTNTNGDIFRLFSSSDTLNNGEVIQISDITITASKHTATVHTWYDQAGSNNAVQATAGSQPKIAENGALLADGLKFNGNSDNFTITNGVSGRSIFAVTNQNIDTTGGGLTGYGQDGISSLLGTAGANSYIFVSNNNSAFNSYAISIDGAVSDSGQYASNGKTLSSAGGNLGTYGDIPSDTNSLLSIIYGSGDPAFDWTRLGSGVNGNIFMQGSMSEVILYTTDQTRLSPTSITIMVCTMMRMKPMETLVQHLVLQQMEHLPQMVKMDLH
jgi:hypothetical protein